MFIPLLIQSVGTLGATEYEFVGGELMEYDGSTTLTRVSTAINSQHFINSLVEFNGRIYGVTGEQGNLLEYYVPETNLSLAKFYQNEITEVSNEVGNSGVHDLGLFDNKITGAGDGTLLQLPFPLHYDPSLASLANNTNLPPIVIHTAFENEQQIRSLTGFGEYLMASTAASGMLLRAGITTNIWSVIGYNDATERYAPFNHVKGYLTELHTLSRFQRTFFSSASPGGVLLKDTAAIGGASSLRSFQDLRTINVADEQESQYEIRSLSRYGVKLMGSTGTGGRLFQDSLAFPAASSLRSFTGGDTQPKATEIEYQYAVPSVEGFAGFVYGATASGGHLNQLGTEPELVWNTLRYSGGEWAPGAYELNDRQSVFRMLVGTSNLYASMSQNQGFYRLSGSSWTSGGGYPGGIDFWLVLCVHNGLEVFGGIGDAYPWANPNAWTNLAPMDAGGGMCCGLASLDYDQDDVYELYGVVGNYTPGAASAPYGTLMVLDTDAEEWATVSSNSDNMTVFVWQNRLFTVTVGGYLLEYEGSSSLTLRGIPAGVGDLTGVAHADGEVWAVTELGRLVSVGIVSGEGSALWDVRAYVPGENFQSIAIRGGEVYVGSITGTLYVWDGSGLTIAAMPWSEGPALRTMAAYGGALMVGLTRPGGFV